MSGGSLVLIRVGSSGLRAGTGRLSELGESRQFPGGAVFSSAEVGVSLPVAFEAGRGRIELEGQSRAPGCVGKVAEHAGGVAYSDQVSRGFFSALHAVEKILNMDTRLVEIRSA